VHVIAAFSCTVHDFDVLLPQTLAVLHEIVIISFLEYFGNFSRQQGKILAPSDA